MSGPRLVEPDAGARPPEGFDAMSEVRYPHEIDGAVECIRAAMRDCVAQGSPVLVRVRSVAPGPPPRVPAAA